MNPTRGKFITFEGIDGAGKSTHIGWVTDRIRAGGRAAIATREPGGTPLGESLRALLLHEPMTHDSEALLMFASRREHLERLIRPALARGDWVICDRFSDATFAYQCGGHGVPVAHVRALEAWIHGDCQPDLTLLFDVPTTVSRARLHRSQAQGRELDKFETEADGFFQRVRAAYLDRARDHPARFRVIDSTRPVDDVRAQLDIGLAHLGID